MTPRITVVTALLLVLASTPAYAQSPASGGEARPAGASAPGGAAASATRVAEPPSEPPPSTWDREQKARGESSDEGRSLAGQIWRTLLSLLLVVALIYGLGRVVLWRMGRGRGVRAGGAGMKVIERLALDTRHSLYVVEVQGDQRFLLGTGGSEGVKLLATLGGSGVTPGGFAGAMAAAAKPAPGAGGEGGS